MIYKMVADFFEENGLTEGFNVQELRWRDSGNKNDAYMIFKPTGGGPIREDLGADYYVSVDVISSLNTTEPAALATSKIISFIRDNPLSSSCFSHIENMSGFPGPIYTTEGRVVFSLLFNVKN